MMLKTVTFALVALIGSAAMAQQMPTEGKWPQARKLAQGITLMKVCGMSYPGMQAHSRLVANYAQAHTYGGKPGTAYIAKYLDGSAVANAPIKSTLCQAQKAQLPRITKSMNDLASELGS